MEFKIVNIARSKCCRCGYINEVERINKNLDMPLINKISLNSLNFVGELIEGLGDIDYYICDDCWNDLLEFFDDTTKED